MMGSTGSTQGETAVIRPATKPRPIAVAIAYLFGLGRRPGCYRRVGLLLRAVLVLLLAAHLRGARRLLLPPAASPAARVGLRGGQVVGQRARNLSDRAELLAGGIERMVR